MLYAKLNCYTGWNDKIIALEKTTWFHFRLMKTGFLFLFLFFFFFFVADHLLVGQLCTNPKSDRSLLSCLKVTQCSSSEFGDAPLYNSCPQPIQVMTTGPLPAPSKCKSGRFNVPRVMKTKFLATVMVFGDVSSEGHIMPPHIFGVGLKVTLKFTWMCWRVWCTPDAIRWPVADPGCGSRTRRRPTYPKRPRLGFRRSATTLYPSLTAPSSPNLNPLDYSVWSYVENITNMTSHNTKARLIAAIRHQRLWKRHAPNSGSVSRRWLRLKAATLNRCQ